MLEELCKRIQHCCATLRRSQNKRNVESCWLKSLTGFKLCATTSNNMQQGVQTDATCDARGFIVSHINMRKRTAEIKDWAARSSFTNQNIRIFMGKNNCFFGVTKGVRNMWGYQQYLPTSLIFCVSLFLCDSPADLWPFHLFYCSNKTHRIL